MGASTTPRRAGGGGIGSAAGAVPPPPLPPAPEGGWERLRLAAQVDPQSPDVGRFAPSTTGPAHPGTLLAALLAWLDARSRPAAGNSTAPAAAKFLLRLEDLDPARCSPSLARAMEQDLRWLGLDWDGEAQLQSGEELAAGHAAALDFLEQQGRLYACSCSRSVVKAAGKRAPDGGWAYPNTCRPRFSAAGGAGGGQQGGNNAAPPFSSSKWREWRAKGVVVRAHLPDGPIEGLRDEDDGEEGEDEETSGGGSDGGASSLPPPRDLSQDPSQAFGDPVVLRRDGAVAYMLAAVVDDAVRARATRIVRGDDIAPSTATQQALRRLLGLPSPRAYRHHLLLLEPAQEAADDAKPRGGRRGGGGRDQDRGASSSFARQDTDGDKSDDANNNANTDKQKKKKKKKLAKLHGSVGAPQLRAAGYTPAEVVGFLAWVSGLRDSEEPVTPQELLAEGFSWKRVRREDQVVAWDGQRLRWLGGADAAADEDEDED
jgi:hypothetical protein